MDQDDPKQVAPEVEQLGHLPFKILEPPGVLRDKEIGISGIRRQKENAVYGDGAGQRPSALRPVRGFRI